jgi:hypothetical protein
MAEQKRRRIVTFDDLNRDIGNNSLRFNHLPNNVLDEIAKRVSNPAAFIASTPVFWRRYKLAEKIKIPAEKIHTNPNFTILSFDIRGADAHRLESMCSASMTDQNVISAIEFNIDDAKSYVGGTTPPPQNYLPNKSFRISCYTTQSSILDLDTDFNCTIPGTPNTRTSRSNHSYLEYSRRDVLPNTDGFTDLILLFYTDDGDDGVLNYSFILRGKDENGIHVQIHMSIDDMFDEHRIFVSIYSRYGEHRNTGGYIDPFEGIIDDFEYTDVTCTPCDQLRKLLDLKRVLFQSLVSCGYNITPLHILNSIKTDIYESHLELQTRSSFNGGPVVFQAPIITYRNSKTLIR